MRNFYNFPIDPIQFIYGTVAVAGGIARYLKGFTDGTPFNLAVFLASAFVSGFSGYMFAVLGLSLSLPEPMLFIMAGVGGFFGDQTMKLIYEWTKSKI